MVGTNGVDGVQTVDRGLGVPPCFFFKELSALAIAPAGAVWAMGGGVVFSCSSVIGCCHLARCPGLVKLAELLSGLVRERVRLPPGLMSQDSFRDLNT